MQVNRGSVVRRHKKCIRVATHYMQWNLHVRPPLVSDQLLSKTSEFSQSKPYLNGTSRKQAPLVSDRDRDRDRVLDVTVL